MADSRRALSNATMAVNWKKMDDDGSGNIDQREFQSKLREYELTGAEVARRKGFSVPSAGPNHYFYTPIADPYVDSHAENHYKKLEKEWVAEDVEEAGGESAMISNIDKVKRSLSGSGDIIQNLARSSARSSSKSARRSSRSSRSSRGSQHVRYGAKPWEPKLLTLEDMADHDAPDKIIPQTTTRLKYGHSQKPRFRTQRDLLGYRAKKMLPDPSFDVDGDGVVSGQDFYLASKFDVNNDGCLDEDERIELRKKMVQAVTQAYAKVPKGKNDKAEAMVKDFTENIDTTVRAKDFKQRFERLYNATAVSMTWDSHRIQDGLQPFDGRDGLPRSLAGAKGGPAVRSVFEQAERPHNSIQDLTTARSNDTLDLDRGPEWIKGGERQKFSGYESRAALLKARKESYRQMAEARVDTRMKQHIIDRNKVGADLPMPKSWGPIRVSDVGQQYEALDTNRDGIISNREYYSLQTKESVGHHGS